MVAVPSLSNEHQYFLGPIGNPDPHEFISAETNRIPFRLANPNIGHWKNTFKSWPSIEKSAPEKSWPVWYKRVSASKQAHWDEIGIGQALALTIANSAKDKPLMAAAAYFWSNTLNALLFNQGPMTPTLLDITMITGLDVTSLANPMSLNTKNTFEFKTKSIGGWSGYIAAYKGKGPVTPREHVVFLLIWLEKFLFCGSSCGPTTNWQFPAEALETKRQFPLGKILLGYLYQMLNNASAKIAVGSVVGVGGPWWLLQTWLNLVAMKVVNRPTAPAILVNFVFKNLKSAVQFVLMLNYLQLSLLQVLADLFSFDIKDYLDEETEEDTTSKALAPLSDDVKKTLKDISHRLGSSLDSLVADCGSIRARFKEIQL